MKGQIEVRFITAITIALTVLFSAITINSIATKGPNEDLTATNLATLHQLSRVADKYTGEALSYAYYREVNKVFEPERYSNTNEEWDVPDWFIYPRGNAKASCKEIDNGVGCVIWNLSGGSSKKDPCPDVVSYSPNPDPYNVFNQMKRDSIAGYLENALGEANRMIAEGVQQQNMGTLYGLYLFGKGISLDYDLDVTTTNGNKKVNVVGTVNTRILDQLEKWGLEVNRMVNTNATLTANMKYREYYERKVGECICERASDDEPISIKTYRVGVYYIELKVINNNTGEVVVEGKFPYIKYFKNVISSVPPDDTEYKNCYMDVP